MCPLFAQPRQCACLQRAFRLNYCESPVTVDGASIWGIFMKITAAFSFAVLTAATALPAQAKELPEHTVLAFNLPECPKGWVEYAAAAGKVPGLLFCEKGLNRR